MLIYTGRIALSVLGEAVAVESRKIVGKQSERRVVFGNGAIVVTLGLVSYVLVASAVISLG
jgi:hypothetical protein